MPLRFYSWCSTRGAHGNLAQSCPAHVPPSDSALPPRFFGVRVANKNKKPQEFSPFNACVIPFTEEAYSIGAIPVAFLNCFEK